MSWRTSVENIQVHMWTSADMQPVFLSQQGQRSGLSTKTHSHSKELYSYNLGYNQHSLQVFGQISKEGRGVIEQEKGNGGEEEITYRSQMEISIIIYPTVPMHKYVNVCLKQPAGGAFLISKLGLLTGRFVNSMCCIEGNTKVQF